MLFDIFFLKIGLVKLGLGVIGIIYMMGLVLCLMDFGGGILE